MVRRYLGSQDDPTSGKAHGTITSTIPMVEARDRIYDSCLQDSQLVSSNINRSSIP